MPDVEHLSPTVYRVEYGGEDGSNTAVVNAENTAKWLRIVADQIERFGIPCTITLTSIED